MPQYCDGSCNGYRDGWVLWNGHCDGLWSGLYSDGLYSNGLEQQCDRNGGSEVKSWAATGPAMVALMGAATLAEVSPLGGNIFSGDHLVLALALASAATSSAAMSFLGGGLLSWRRLQWQCLVAVTVLVSAVRLVATVPCHGGNCLSWVCLWRQHLIVITALVRWW